MLRAPKSSFERRTDQVPDEGMTDTDALAVDRAAIAGDPALFFSGNPLFDRSSTSQNSSAGVNTLITSQDSGASSTFAHVETAPAALTIANGGSAEIVGASARPVTFMGTSGTLKLDDALAFTGKVSGIAGSDAIDLADVSFGIQTQATFLGNETGGTL